MSSQDDPDELLSRSRRIRPEPSVDPEITGAPPDESPGDETGPPSGPTIGGKDPGDELFRRRAIARPESSGDPETSDPPPEAQRRLPPPSGPLGHGSPDYVPPASSDTGTDGGSPSTLPDGDTWFDSPRRSDEAVPAPVPIPRRNAQEGANSSVRMGLWGASRSGKTTVVSALPVAAMQTPDVSRRWVVSGVGQLATDILTEGVQLLTERRFPPATETRRPIMWSFQGMDDSVETVRPRGIRRRPPPATRQPVDFALELQDVPGEYYKSGNIHPSVIENLALSRGLIYLLDPVLDDEEDLRSFNFFFEVLMRVTARVRDEGRMVGGRLPHHVSVLVTKFDDTEFFRSAVQANWVNQEPSGARMPYVPVEMGKGFFDWVCSERQGGTAGLVKNALETYFHQNRIEYFACSAVGFRLNPDGVFDYSDYTNVEIFGGKPRIRSVVRPVNVLEPLIRLERRIRLGLPAASR